MGEKVYIQDIINLLAEQRGMSKKDAETFVKTMFNLIKEVLETEKFVKIKGLGTFKLIDVESRESIDVNTGERFTIKGYTKISFTPDPAIRDLINKPFAHFETTVLNADTALEDTPVFENDDLDTEDNEGIDSESNQEENKEISVTEVYDNNSEPEKDNTIDPQTAEEKEEDTFEEEQAIPVVIPEDEKVPEKEEKSVEKPEAEEGQDNLQTIIPTPETPLKENKTKSKKGKKKKEKIESAQPILPERQDIVIEKSSRVEAIERKVNISYFIGIVFVTLLLLSGIVFFIYRPDIIETLFTRPAPKSVPIVANPPSDESNKLTGTMDEQDLVNQQPMLDDGTSLFKQPSPEESTSTVEEKRPQISLPVNEQPAITSSPEKQVVANAEVVNSETIITGVRKGHDNIIADSTSYIIVGTMTTHKIEVGETLTMVSRRFYETKDLWPYIVMHNRNIITDPNRVPAGTVIRIPALRNK